MDLSWLYSEGITNMNPKKIEVIKELVEESKGKPMNQAFPAIMKASQKLKKENLAFTPDETTMLLAILTKDMSPNEKKKVDAMKDIVNKNMGKKKD